MDVFFLQHVQTRRHIDEVLNFLINTFLTFIFRLFTILKYPLKKREVYSLQVLFIICIKSV